MPYRLSLQEAINDPLWPILVETAKSHPLFKYRLAYARDHIFPQNPTISPNELAIRLGCSYGEALVILYELQKEAGKGAHHSR
ncbi:hypothetical protein DRN94_000745 [archaeon]|nr:hypothetical protein [archaeon]